MTLYMETTQISPAKTIGEITALLLKAGARQFLTEYASDGGVAGLTFMLPVNGVLLPYKLPARSESIFRLFQRRHARIAQRMATVDRAQAERVAWRQLLRWIQAQIAMIDVGMVKTEEVFMPYVRLESGETWFERLEATKYRALPGPSGE